MADVTVDPECKNTEELVHLGIKAYVMRDYNAAVTALSRAIELMVAEHGDKADPLGIVYLYYGKTLLELSREEGEALGDAVPREINSDSDEEETPATDMPAIEERTTQKDDKSEESKPDDAAQSHEQKNGESSSATAPTSTQEPEGESTDEKTEEEPSDLQLAWEVLELAKLIFEQRGEEGKQHLAETLVVLGEVSLESENFENGITDIKQGLEIHKSILETDNRNLAESYYKYAVALSINNQIDEAIDNFNTALDILRNRITNLKKNEEEEKDQIKDIEELIPEIEEKVADMKTFKEEAKTKLLSTMTMKQEQKSTDSKFDASSSSIQVNNISHLVKRKRDADEEDSNPSKKQNSS